MSNRECVSKEALLEWINSEIQKNEGCKDVRLLGVYQLAELDDSGNNWSTSTARVTGVPAEIYGPVCNAVVEEAKRRFNLAT